MESRRTAVVLFSSVTLFTIISIFMIYWPIDDNGDIAYKFSTASKPAFQAPKNNIWAELTTDEANSVYDFLSEELGYLNLTKRPGSGKDNFLFIVETLRPNKTDAAPYLYDDGPEPERWAKAAVSQSINGESYMAYYMAGPLPITSSSSVQPLVYPFTSGSNQIRNPVQDFVAISQFGFEVAENISDITQELLGASVSREDPEGGLQCWPRGSRVERGGMVLWFQMYRPGLGSGARTLLPQGIYVKVDARSADMSGWKVEQYYYNGVLYDDQHALRTAVKEADFHRTPPNLDGSWTETEDYDSQPDGRELPPPVSIQPYGPRYKLDKEAQYVSWFGFTFYITTAQSTGISLFDIRFKGDRVAYELGLQEALAHYAGDDPMQGGLEFMDSFFGMGKNMFELVPGYDCPAYADYLDVQWYQLHQTHKLHNSICLFEFTADHLLSRHTAQYTVTASRNTFLVLRSVSTVGNYDYTIEYLFYLDGTLEVKVRASGFIFAAFYTANDNKNEGEYGHRIHDALSSSMHDHVLNFKADLDVAGPENDFVRMAIEPVTKTYPWDAPDVSERNTMHLVTHPVTHETGLDWPPNSGEFFLVYNADKRNAWGERRGYRITSGTGLGSTPHLTIENSTTLGDSARWAEHDVWVVRRKDTEPRSADPLNYFAPHDPIINFNNIANGESLERGGKDEGYDGDLVVYFNLGAHHIPVGLPPLPRTHPSFRQSG